MRFFDLHCDTLYRALEENKTIDEPDFQLSVTRGKAFDRWIQCMAVWIPDTLSPTDSFELFARAYTKLINNSQKLNIDTTKHTLLFTVENGAALGDDLKNIEIFKECGVKLVTLTWNAENKIGGGSATDVGLSEFGKKAIQDFEKSDIICDISHACDKLFYDVVQNSTKPIIASHSNSRSVTNHKRNLTDEQFEIIKQKKGLVGLNFCNKFLNSEFENATSYDIIKHADYFLALGGEDILCIGSDFDGTDMPKGITNISDIPNLYELFLKHNYSQKLVDKIFFENAYNFFYK